MRMFVLDCVRVRVCVCVWLCANDDKLTLMHESDNGFESWQIAGPTGATMH